MSRWETGFQMEPEVEWTGPDPLMEMMKRARPICRKTRGHDKKLVEAVKAWVAADATFISLFTSIEDEIVAENNLNLAEIALHEAIKDYE